MSIIDTLVMDRTKKDVENGTENGYYNYNDLNRVNAAAAYLVEELESAGYSAPGFSAQQMWGLSSIPTESGMDEYLSSVKSLRYIIDSLDEKENVCVVGIGITDGGYSAGNGGVQLGPSTMSWLDFISANDIERILFAVNRSLERLRKSVVPCGAASAGGDYF